MFLTMFNKSPLALNDYNQGELSPDLTARNHTHSILESLLFFLIEVNENTAMCSYYQPVFSVLKTRSLEPAERVCPWLEILFSKSLQ